MAAHLAAVHDHRQGWPGLFAIEHGDLLPEGEEFEDDADYGEDGEDEFRYGLTPVTRHSVTSRHLQPALLMIERMIAPSAKVILLAFGESPNSGDPR